jgi:lysozyme
MTPDDFSKLREAVKLDEGLRLTPYIDTVGKMTIGYGRNLTDTGIRQSEAAVMLENDLNDTVANLTQAHPLVLTLSATRQIVLANMAFNLGLPRLNRFTKLWEAIGKGDFTAAAKEMLASTWATQVGLRAARLAAEMENGHDQTPMWTKGPQP